MEVIDNELDIKKPITLSSDTSADCSIIAIREGRLFPIEVEAQWPDGRTVRFYVDPTDGVGIRVRGRGMFSFVNKDDKK